MQIRTTRDTNPAEGRRIVATADGSYVRVSRSIDDEPATYRFSYHPAGLYVGLGLGRRAFPGAALPLAAAVNYAGELLDVLNKLEVTG